jgi:hypothetical protein
MNLRRLTNASAALLAVAMLAACGGGGGMSSSVPNGGQPPVTPPQTTTQSLGVTFAGTQTLAKVRSPRDLNATPVTVSFNGAVIGTGTLDANGHAKIKFTAAIPPGSTVTVTAGSLTVTATLAMTTAGTAVLVTVNADGTVTVTTAADKHDDGKVDADDPEQENEDEDGHGNVTSVTAGDAVVLPANAPFSFVNACGTITLTPKGAAAFLKFEEKGSDGESDDAGRVKFEGAFTAPLQFAVVSSAARVHIEIFDAQHKRLIEVKAPIGAFTSGTNPNASPCPSPTATATASASPSPKPSESPEPEPSETPRPSPSPTATPR